MKTKQMQEKKLNLGYSLDYKKIRKEVRKGIFNLPICKKCVGIKEEIKND